MSTPISELPKEEAFQTLMSICNKIYIARNITLSNDSILEQLKMIDKLFRTTNDN
jgi:hypothetical protein